MKLLSLLLWLFGDCFSTADDDCPSILNSTSLLTKALKWDCGTVYQIASYTGLTVQEVIDLSTYEHGTHEDSMGVNDYNVGRTLGHNPEERDYYKGNSDYWKGVLHNQYLKDCTLHA